MKSPNGDRKKKDMEKGKFRLSPQQEKAVLILTRRQNALKKRIAAGTGSNNSLNFDLDECVAISTILDLVSQISEK